VIGLSTLANYLALRNSITPSSSNEQFSDTSIELAPGSFFSKVFIPTAAELEGDFSSVDLPLINTRTGTPFVHNIMQAVYFGDSFAFLIGPNTSVPEPSTLALLGLALLSLAAIAPPGQRQICRHRDVIPSERLR